MKLKLYKHQNATMRLYRRSPSVFDMSEPGTGKTAPALVSWKRYAAKRMLVVCVKSSVDTVWLDEAANWIPDATVAAAMAPDRFAAFRSGADVVVTNTDAVKWIVENRPGALLGSFDTLVVDESAYFKHPNSQRSKALISLRDHFERISLLSGTPYTKTVAELWSQAAVLDGGKRLGVNYHRLRAIVSEKRQVGNRPEAVEWVDNPGAVAMVYGQLKDISIRHAFDDCVDIPPTTTRRISYRPNRKLRALYDEFKTRCLLELEKGLLVGVNAAVMRNKLLQLLSGAVYYTENKYEVVDSGRYDLICDLIEARPHSVVFFNWRHQREQLSSMLTKRKVAHGILDGKVSQKQRKQHVDDFQNGDLRAMLIHPQTGSHALTLTRGTSVIWCSPTYRPDHLRQGLHRIRRTGQTKRTECIMIEARDTVEPLVYKKLMDKDAHMVEFFDLIEDL